MNTFFRYTLFAIGFAILLAGCGGNGDDDDSGASPTTIADIVVSASSGNDITGDGSAQSPYKTITAALTYSESGDVVLVKPGIYDTANGEVFPLVLPPGVVMTGDVANKGNGTIQTLISGLGPVGPANRPTIEMGADTVISGFAITNGLFEVLATSILVDGVDSTISNNTFLTDSYAGVWITNNPSTTLVEKNIFQTMSYGVRAHGVATVTVDDNDFETPSLPVDGSSSMLISNNRFTSSRSAAIQTFSSASPTITGNSFISSGFIYGAIYAQFSSTPKIRNNTFILGAGRAIYTGTGANAPDLGTAVDPGGNVFDVTGGLDLEHQGTESIFAHGNSWSATPPVCGANILVTSTGSVEWGPGGGENCP